MKKHYNPKYNYESLISSSKGYLILKKGVPDYELELLKSASLFVLTSHSDVHPIAVQDALTMGAPVIITEVCDYPEVEVYDAGLIVDENINQITDAILNVVNNDERLREMSENAKRLVLERFQLKIQIKKYDEMYKDVINRFHEKLLEKI